MSQFKKLLGPMILDVHESNTCITLTLNSINANEKLPGFLVVTESVFLVHLIRLATREHIIPLKILTQEKLNHEHAYADFFGTNPELGQKNQITFSAKDAQCPFLTENESMWQFFEPELTKTGEVPHLPESGGVGMNPRIKVLRPKMQCLRRAF